MAQNTGIEFNGGRKYRERFFALWWQNLQAFYIDSMFMVAQKTGSAVTYCKYFNLNRVGERGAARK